MKTSFGIIGLLAALSLAVASCSHGGDGSSSSTSSEPNPILASAPAQQKKFCATIVKYEPSDEETTKFFETGQMSAEQKQKFAAKRAARKADMASLLGNGNVDGWVGKIVAVRDATSTDVAVILDVGCDAKFEAVALDSAITAQTVIPKSSPLYSEAKALKEGDRVSFSGHLIQKASLPDGYQELSFGDFPSLDEPRFNFALTKLAASR